MRQESFRKHLNKRPRTPPPFPPRAQGIRSLPSAEAPDTPTISRFQGEGNRTGGQILHQPQYYPRTNQRPSEPFGFRTLWPCRYECRYTFHRHWFPDDCFTQGMLGAVA